MLASWYDWGFGELRGKIILKYRKIVRTRKIFVNYVGVLHLGLVLSFRLSYTSKVRANSVSARLVQVILVSLIGVLLVFSTVTCCFFCRRTKEKMSPLCKYYPVICGGRLFLRCRISSVGAAC